MIPVQFWMILVAFKTTQPHAAFSRSLKGDSNSSKRDLNSMCHVWKRDRLIKKVFFECQRKKCQLNNERYWQVKFCDFLAGWLARWLSIKKYSSNQQVSIEHAFNILIKSYLGMQELPFTLVRRHFENFDFHSFLSEMWTFGNIRSRDLEKQKKTWINYRKMLFHFIAPLRLPTASVN